jgi:hypothetical protein
MATFQTYQSIGNREDLTDIITNISPMDTWFTSTIGSANVKGTYHEWQVDALSAAGANAKVEGASASDGTITPTSRLGNYTQIMEKCFKISKTEEAIDKAGRKSEIAYQTEKHMKELARDLEYALLLSSAAASGASGTARTLNGFYGFVSASGSKTSGSATGVQLTEALLNDNLQAIWAAGGKPSNVLCGAYQKRKISSFTTNTRYMVADENKLASAVDVYQSDFGTIAIRLHHQVQTTLPSVLFVIGDTSTFAKAWLRGIKRQQEPFAGDADLFTIRGEVTLEAKDGGKGHGYIFSMATA